MILVTGASGFIGRSVVRQLGLAGIPARALVRPTSDVSGLDSAGLGLVYGDMGDEASLEAALSGVSAVINCAAHTQAGPPEALDQINVRAVDRLCGLCVKCGVRRLVHVSSAAVISSSRLEVLDDSVPPCPHDGYARSKHESEKLVESWAARGLESVVLRPCMVYGPGERHVFRFVSRLLRLRILLIPGPGRGHWPIVYVDDVARALIAAVSAPGPFSGAYLVGPDRTFPITEIFGAMADIMGVARPGHVWPWLTRAMVAACLAANRAGIIDVSFSRKTDGFFESSRSYDISRTRAVLGWKPEVGLDEGLRRMLESFGVVCRGRAAPPDAHGRRV